MLFFDKLFLKFFLPRIFGHWKSTTAGIATTLALIQLFQHSYKGGMSWEQWLCAALPGAIGIVMEDVKHLKAAAAVLLFLIFGVPGARAQVVGAPTAPSGSEPVATPSQLPGWQVSVNAGYSLVQGAGTNNGFFSSLAVALPQPASWKNFGIALRGDYFTITSPNVYVVDFGPEVRATPFSIPGFMNGEKFQPFLDLGLGLARSAATLANATPQSNFALKIGGGIDLPISSTVNWRLIEVDYIRSKIFPGGSVVLSNVPQVETGLGITF